MSLSWIWCHLEDSSSHFFAGVVVMWQRAIRSLRKVFSGHVAWLMPVYLHAVSLSGWPVSDGSWPGVLASLTTFFKLPWHLPSA